MSMGLAGQAAAAFTFTKIVDNFTRIPGGGGSFFSINGNVGLAAVSGRWVVFNAADANLTIWRANLNGQQLKKVIDARTFIPGWTDAQGKRYKFNQLYGQFHRLDGETLVLVGLARSGDNSGVGIFTRSINGGPVRNLVDTQDTHPDITTAADPDKRFHGFPSDFSINRGVIVFMNRQKIFSIPRRDGNITAVAGASLGTQNITPPCPACPLFDTVSKAGNDVLVRAGNVFGHASIQAVSSNGAPGSWEIIAGQGTHAPNTPANFGFNRFEFWGPVADERFVFGGGSSVDANDIGPYIKGIYSSGPNGLRRLADENMNVPDGRGKFDFVWGGSKSPILAENGIVIFGAQDARGRQGLYAVRQTGGRIVKIIGFGDRVGDGLRVAGLNIGPDAFDGKTLVFTVVYDKFQGAGIYATEVDLR
jgi:hypothetical protein